MTQRRPQGPGWPINAKWKADVARELRERGWSQSDLAEKVGVTPSAINNLLSDRRGVVQSRLVPQIHALLGWLPPEHAGAEEEDLDDIRRLWPDLTDDQRALVISLAKQLTGRK